MRIDIIQFDADVSAGTYGRWLAEWGIEVRTVGPDSGSTQDFTAADGLLLLGGHMGVAERQKHALLNDFHAQLPELVEAGRNILAICLGAQLLADALGGRATAKSRGERSVRQIKLTGEGEKDPLFAGLSNPFVSFQWHNDSFDLPPAARHLAFTETCPGQAFRLRNAYGLQFHPEVDEQIVAGWCRRAQTDDRALREFMANRLEYRQGSRRILENFLSSLKGEPVSGAGTG